LFVKALEAILGVLPYRVRGAILPISRAHAE
jgi:hypothetical protein